MKTLKMIPITKKPTNLLAHADNGIYEVKIRYWGDEDVSDIHLDTARADDIHIFVELKLPSSIFPKIDIVFSDTIDTYPVRIFSLQFDNMSVDEDEYENFLKYTQIGKDTLDDIKEILTGLVPHLMTEEQFQESKNGLSKSGKELRTMYD